MSDAAARQRSTQQHWAEPGSRHDAVVKAAKIGLPAAVGVLAALLLMAPLAKRSEVSFVLDKNEVESAPERMRIEAARYTGTDKEGQSFLIQAQRAVQRTSDQPIVDIQGMLARIGLQNGTALIRADRGQYNLDRQQVAIQGPVRVSGPEGEQLVTRDVVVDFRNQTVRGGNGTAAGREGELAAGQVAGDLRSERVGLSGGVTGRIKLGEFQAGRVRADLASRTIVLDGGARLKIEQGAVR